MTATGKTQGACFTLILGALLLTSCGGSDQSSVWTMQGQEGLWIQRDILSTETEHSVVDKLFYDVLNERVYIASRIYPGDRMLTVDDVSNARLQYYGLDPMGLSREEEQTKDDVSAIELDANHSILLSSGLQRSIGGETRRQPNGALVLRTIIDETTYEVERTAGFPFFGDSYAEQVGDGKVSLELSGAEGVLFSIEDRYTENSSEFTAMFTPDGRYVLVVLPDEPESAAAQLPGGHRLVLVGGLPIDRDKLKVVAELTLKGKAKEEFETRQIEQQQYRDGLITAEAYYGEVYVKAVDKIRRCDDITYIIGEIERLAVRDSVLDFGQPKIVGKVFAFDYEAPTSSGEIQVIVLDPEHELTESNSYRSYLESIDIRSDSGVRYANCP
ncbi:MAG: hypothetical protein HOC70_07675 [Gammaproteobacteria bacterium]|nr:hypothetical protein [Gammaproteobacteria bacterium]